MRGPADLLGELRRRGVFGTTALYVVAAWVLIQVVSEILPAFNIPGYAIRYVWMGVVAAFPLALFVGWRYDISRHGVQRTAPAGSGPQADASLHRIDYLLLGSVGVLVVGITGVLTLQIARQAGTGSEQPLRQMTPNSVAVLPLDNFTGDQEQEYFVAGLHEALTAGLTGISALKVISRTSATAVAGGGRTVPEIGRLLGARNIIEGSVFQTGNRVRVTVQLIDALSDQHLWAGNFEREMTDLLALHSELTRAIAEQIQVTLTPEEAQRLSIARPVDPKIYQLYLKGMYFIRQYTPEGIQKGLPYLHQAVELDPGNARAYAGLALGYNRVGHGFGRDAFPKALAAARQALQLDEHLGEAWAALAEAKLYHEYDYAGAERAFQRALQLAPSLDEAHGHYGALLSLLGRWEESFYHLNRARELTPLDPGWSAFEGWLYMSRGEYERARELYDESLALAPEFPFGLAWLGDLHRLEGRPEDAIAMQERIPEGNPIRNWALGPTYALTGRPKEAERIAREMAVDPGPKDKLFIALTHAALGDIDQAMHWFEICYESRVDWLPWIVLSRGYAGVDEALLGNPRFQALIARLDLPPAPDA